MSRKSNVAPGCVELTAFAKLFFWTDPRGLPSRRNNICFGKEQVRITPVLRRAIGRIVWAVVEDGAIEVQRLDRYTWPILQAGRQGFPADFDRRVKRVVKRINGVLEELGFPYRFAIEAGSVVPVKFSGARPK